MTGEIYFYDIIGPFASPWSGWHTLWFLIVVLVLIGLYWYQKRTGAPSPDESEMVEGVEMFSFDLDEWIDTLRIYVDEASGMTTEQFLIGCYLQLQDVFTELGVKEITAFSLQEMEQQRYYLEQHLDSNFMEHIAVMYQTIFRQDEWSTEQWHEMIETIIVDVTNLHR